MSIGVILNSCKHASIFEGGKIMEKYYKIENGQIVEVDLESLIGSLMKPSVSEAGVERTDVRAAYSPDEVSRMTGLGRNTVLQLLNSGKIGSVRAGKRWLIPARAVDEFLAGGGGK